MAEEVAGAEGVVDPRRVERLERLIKQQQEQLEAMRQELNQLKQTAIDAQTRSRETRKTVSSPVEKTVTIGRKPVKLALSAQVNRMVNIVDDGKNTEAYFVDNDASNTRVRLVGSVSANDDLTLGSRLEVAMTADESGDVNQDNQDSGDFFNVRWADLTLDSKRCGKLWLGRGDTASNNTAEVDLSEVNVLAYSNIAGPAGGMLFREKTGDNALTAVSVSDAFNNRDGLSRRSRLRYDTPAFRGFHLAGSLESRTVPVGYAVSAI